MEGFRVPPNTRLGDVVVTAEGELGRVIGIDVCQWELLGDYVVADIVLFDLDDHVEHLRSKCRQTAASLDCDGLFGDD